MTHFSPREIVSELDRYIVGQNDAKRAVAIALRNRWRRQQLQGDLKEEVLPKNILMIGPDRRRQDRDLAAARQACGRALHQGRGDEVHRGRLRRPRRRFDHPRPRRGGARPRQGDEAQGRARQGREECRGARARRPRRRNLVTRNARDLPQAAARGRAQRQGNRDPSRRDDARACRCSTSPARRAPRSAPSTSATCWGRRSASVPSPAASPSPTATTC